MNPIRLSIAILAITSLLSEWAIAVSPIPTKPRLEKVNRDRPSRTLPKKPTGTNLSQKPATDFYSRGVDKLKTGDYQAAIGDFTQALRLNPKNVDAFNNRGYAHDELGDYQDAIADYNRAIQLDPKAAIAYNNRGVTNRKMGKEEDAIADYTQAIQLNANYATAYYNRGTGYSNLGETEKAIEDFNQAIQLKANYASAYYNRANTYEKLLKDHPAALADFQQAADLYQQQGKTQDYQDALERIQALQR